MFLNVYFANNTKESALKVQHYKVNTVFGKVIKKISGYFLLEHLLGLVGGLGRCQGRSEQPADAVGLNQMWDRPGKKERKKKQWLFLQVLENEEHMYLPNSIYHF